MRHSDIGGRPHPGQYSSQIGGIQFRRLVGDIILERLAQEQGLGRIQLAAREPDLGQKQPAQPLQIQRMVGHGSRGEGHEKALEGRSMREVHRRLDG